MGTNREKMINGEPYLPPVMMSPNVQPLTALHPIEDHDARIAGSVVTRDLPAHVLAVGNPARVVRKI